MNFYKLFYWITVADGVKHFFDVASDIFTAFAIISLVIVIACMIGTAGMMSVNKSKNDQEDNTDPDIRAWKSVRTIASKIMYISTFLSIIMWTGFVFTPTKRDALMIVAGGAVGNFIVSDSSSKQIPSEITLFLREKIRSEIQEIKLKDVVPDADTLQSKTKEELIELYKRGQH